MNIEIPSPLVFLRHYRIKSCMSHEENQCQVGLDGCREETAPETITTLLWMVKNSARKDGQEFRARNFFTDMSSNSNNGPCMGLQGWPH